jgi:hypothetical protein
MESRKGNTNYLLSPEFLTHQLKERSDSLNYNARCYSVTDLSSVVVNEYGSFVEATPSVNVSIGARKAMAANRLVKGRCIFTSLDPARFIKTTAVSYEVPDLTTNISTIFTSLTSAISDCVKHRRAYKDRLVFNMF